MSRFSRRWAGEDSAPGLEPAQSAPRSPAVFVSPPAAIAPTTEEPTLTDDQLLALRTALYVNGTPLAQAARDFRMSVTSAAKLCSAETRFIGPWPRGVGSVPAFAVVRARG